LSKRERDGEIQTQLSLNDILNLNF